MRDLTLSQEYLLCAVNEKGRLPHLGVERTVCLVAAALLVRMRVFVKPDPQKMWVHRATENNQAK